MPFFKNFKLFDQLMRKFFVYIFTFLLVINVSVVTNAKNLKLVEYQKCHKICLFMQNRGIF